MTIVYRLLGIAARLNERMSHFSINFVPFNWIVMGALTVLFGYSAVEARDAVVNGKTPRAVSVGEVLDHKDLNRNYVSVKGMEVSEPVFQKVSRMEGSQAETVEESYVALVDPAAVRALLVQRHGAFGEGADAKVTEATITGMLVPIESDLKAKLAQTGGKVDDVPVETDYMLVEGNAPGDATTFVPLTFVSGLLLAVFGLTFALKYVIFQKTAPAMNVPGIPPAIDPQRGIDLRVTGKFVLDAKNSRRFLNVNAGLFRLETGDVALVSNIDASSRFYGVTTSKRVGLWSIVLSPNGLQKLELGRLYDGFGARPAVRIRYVEVDSRSAASAILSFGSESERDMMIGEIHRLAGYSLSTAGVS